MSLAALIGKLSATWSFLLQILRLAILVVVILLGIKYWNWLRGGDHAYERFRLSLLSTDQSHMLVTGLARVEVFRVKKKGKWSHINRIEGATGPLVKLENLDGFCSRSYDVVLGYDDYRAAIGAPGATPTEVPFPTVLATNLIEPFEWGDGATEECIESMDADTPKWRVKDAMVADDVWRRQMESGRQILVGMADVDRPACGASGSKNDAPDASDECPGAALRRALDAERTLGSDQFTVRLSCGGEDIARPASASCRDALTRLQANAPPPRPASNAVAMANAMVASPKVEMTPALPEVVSAGGRVGTFTVTFSGTSVMDSARRVRFLAVIPLWEKKAFFFRREIVDVTFGAQLSGATLRRPWFPWPDGRAVLDIDEPETLAINRQVVLQGFGGSLDELSRDEPLSVRLNRGILEQLQTMLETYRPAALRSSRAMLRRRFENEEIRVRFVSRAQEQDSLQRLFPVSAGEP